jgi:hypothetical protein
MKEDEMEWACITHWRNGKCLQNVGEESEQRAWETQAYMVTLKCILKRNNVRVCGLDSSGSEGKVVPVLRLSTTP